MAWLESHQSLRDHPKKDRLAELLFNGTVPLDVSDYAAAGLLHYLWYWALDYSHDGDLSKFSDGQVAKGCRWHGDATLLIGSLIESGFVDQDRHIHDWDQYVGRLLERRERDRLRVKSWRENVTKPEANADGTRFVQGDLQTYQPTKKRGVTPRKGQVPVDNSPKKPVCKCGCELQYDGDGTEAMHCPSCDQVTV